METRAELASAFKSKLHGIPQDPVHHPEGDVLTHTRLVRKAIPRAIQELKQAQVGPLRNVLQGIDFQISPEEEKILALAAWIHDIGKTTATTIGGKPWQQGGEGRIQAIGHQDKEHFLPQLKDLEGFAPEETKQLYLTNQGLINWLVEHHMDFTSGQGFSKKFIADNFDGAVAKAGPMKLLLILMWADKMGRRPEDTLAKAIEGNTKNLLASSEIGRIRAANIARQKGQFQGSPEDFAQMLKSKMTDPRQRLNAIKGKFPELPDDQTQRLA